MNRKMLIKLVIDLIMTVLMLVEMAYNFTGNKFHELSGSSLFILFIIHNILNRRWYITIFKGKMNVRRTLNITVNILFLITMLAVMLSAIPLSRTVFAFLQIRNNGLIARQIHTLAAYWGLILMAVHIGIHWEMIISGLQKMVGITGISTIRTIILKIIAILIVVHGMQASFDRNIGSKLILYSTFDTFNPDETLIKVFIDYLSIIGVYICGTYYIMKIFFRKIEVKSVKRYS